MGCNACGGSGGGGGGGGSGGSGLRILTQWCGSRFYLHAASQSLCVCVRAFLPIHQRVEEKEREKKQTTKNKQQN